MFKLYFILICMSSVLGFEELSLFKNEKFLYSFLENLNLRNDVSPICIKSLTDFVRGFFEGEAWAVTMFDSFEKFPTGILAGRRKIIGQFSECVDSFNNNFTGQHCMIEIANKQNNSNFFLSWNENILAHLKRNHFSYGICVPSTCNSTDLMNIFDAVGLHQHLEFQVNETSCTTGTIQKMRTEDWITILFLLLILLITLASTIYDLRHKITEKNGNQSNLKTSFSLYKNYKILTEVNENAGQINILHGLRFLSIAWVLLGHYYGTLLYSSPSNIIDVFLLVDNKAAIFGTNSYLSVDSFFFLSGLLICFVFFRDISKRGSFDAPLAIIHRYLRLTPSFAVVILLHVTVFSRVGNGPLWKNEMKIVESSCRKNWWSNLLYIENFFPGYKNCLSQSWYLSADMQMFALAPFILYIILLQQKLAPFILGLLIMGTSFLSFIISYKNNLDPNISFSLKSENINAELMEYRNFATRMPTWLVGIVTGYIICGIHAKKINFKLSKVWVILGWLVFLLIGFGSWYGITGFMPYGSYHSSMEKASYRAFHRLGWGISLSWVVIACVSGYGGPISHLLSLNIFQPLAKLSYGIFLIHKMVQVYRISNTKDLKLFSTFDGIYTYIGDLILSIALSVPLVLLVELPFTHIDRCVFKNIKILPLPKSSKFREDKTISKDNLSPSKEKVSNIIVGLEKEKAIK